MQYRLRLSNLSKRVANVALGLAMTASAVTTASVASAQAFPFPSSNAATGNGRFTTTVLTSSEIKALYDRWKQTFIGTCNGTNQLRVVYPENMPANDTRSEGIGYGMVIAAYMGDQPTFTGLRNFYFAHLDGRGLMNWKYNDCNGIGAGGQGSAADADVDAAFALIVANKQWPGGTFGADANTLLNSIRQSLFLNQCAGILLAGTTFADCGCINPSYIPPGYYVAFAATQAGQAATWNTARTNSYTYFNSVNDNTTGLVPAWSSSNGSLNLSGNCTPQVSGGGAPSEFQADAARTPWRVATDYLWTGNASARTFLQSIAGFANRQPRITAIVDRYQLGGAPLPGPNLGNNPLNAVTLNATTRRSTFTMGGFATAMMASSQDDLDRFTGAWQSLYLPGDNSGQNRAFGSSLAILYGLLVTGYMWDPISATAPTLRPPPAASAAVAGNLVTNGDFDEGIRAWSTGNFPDPPDSEGYAMHLGGEVHLVIQKNNPLQPYNLQFSQTVNVRANQKYLLSIRARSATPRPVRLVVAQVAFPYATYGQLVNRASETDPLALTPMMATYDTVFESKVADPAARLAVQFGDSTAEVVIDDIVLTPTDLPATVPGELAGVTPPTPPDGTPTTPGTPSTPGTPTPVTGNGDIGQVIPGTGDNSSGTGAPQVGGDGAGVSGGLPPTPSGRPSGSGTCTTDTDCGGEFKCSRELSLCWEPTYGYVWNPTANAWQQPPKNVLGCGPDYVFWPKQNGCYDPDSGYAFNPSTLVWVYVGDYYTTGRDSSGSADGGCSVGLASSRSTNGWMLAGLLGTAIGLARRRRHA